MFSNLLVGLAFVKSVELEDDDKSEEVDADRINNLYSCFDCGLILFLRLNPAYV